MRTGKKTRSFFVKKESYWVNFLRACKKNLGGLSPYAGRNYTACENICKPPFPKSDRIGSDLCPVTPIPHPAQNAGGRGGGRFVCG